MSFAALVFLTLGIALLDHQEEPGSMGAWLRGHPHAVAGFVAYGPVVFAAFLLVTSGDSLSFRWPFAHEDVLGKFGLHFMVLDWCGSSLSLRCCWTRGEERLLPDMGRGVPRRCHLMIIDDIE